LKEKLRAANQIARENVKEEKNKAKKYYDRKTKSNTFKVGDKVLLHDETLRRGISKKLEVQWIGPYTIMEKKFRSELYSKNGLTKNNRSYKQIETVH
jgi:hypothetical protein